MKIYNGQVIGAANASEASAAKKELLSQSFKRAVKSKDKDGVIEEAASDPSLDERMNARMLSVTPDVLAVAAGATMTLRVRCNCAWNVISSPEAATVVASERRFGEGEISVSAPEDAPLDGQIVVRTDDESVEAVVTLVPEYAPTEAQEASSEE